MRQARKEYKMKKYFVVANIWDEEKERKVRYIAGEFTQKLNANIFKWIYNEYYDANAEVVEEYDLVNK